MPIRIRRHVLILGLGLGLLGPMLAWAQTATITGSFTPAPNATSTKVFKKAGTGAYSLLTTIPNPGTTFTDPGNALGATYCFQLAGSNSSGDGPLTAEQCIIPLLLPGNVTNVTLGYTVAP